MIYRVSRIPRTHREAVLGPEGGDPAQVVLGDAGGDDQEGGVGVTQLVAAIHPAERPALIGQALRTHTHSTISTTHTHNTISTTRSTITTIHSTISTTHTAPSL